jgi:hypothetical protein
MPNVSGTLMIELALLMAIGSPCNSDGGFASFSKTIPDNQSEFALAATGERPANAGATLRADDGAEGTEKKQTCAAENVIPGTSKEARGLSRM